MPKAALYNTEGIKAVSYTHLDVYKRQMFGYATDLRSLTQGRGNYVMQYDHYEKAPPDVLEQLFKSRGYGLSLIHI